jgi:hypothetical protein
MNASAQPTDPVPDACVTAARVWLGAALADAETRECVLFALGEYLSPHATNASSWLAGAAEELPRGVSVRLLMQLLSEAESLLGSPC